MNEPTDHEPSQELSEVLAALDQAPRSAELDGLADAVASMQSALVPAGTTEGATLNPFRKSARVAVLAAAGILVVGGAAAAARYEPTDRPPTIDTPPSSLPPVELPSG